MSYSITRVLYGWMHKRRIVTDVALEMNVPVTTLCAELSPKRFAAKLGADSLVPLFQAIRQAGYGEELNGILFGFIRELKGEELASIADEDLVPQVLSLARSLGNLSECADRIPRISQMDELQKIHTLLITEMLPVVLQMESIIVSRMNVLRPPEEPGTATLVMDTDL